MNKIIPLMFTLTLLSSCQKSYEPVPTPVERQFTLGVAQREISQGMSQGDVATVLGSPNIVTKDKCGLETWVYDKIASEASYKQSSSGICLILIGGSSSQGYARTSQKTLTIVIKYNSDQLVESVSYHASQF